MNRFIERIGGKRRRSSFLSELRLFSVHGFSYEFSYAPWLRSPNDNAWGERKPGLATEPPRLQMSVLMDCVPREIGRFSRQGKCTENLAKS